MVLGTGGYEPFLSSFHEVLRGVPVPALHQITQGLHPAAYNRMSFFSGYHIDEVGWHTW